MQLCIVSIANFIEQKKVLLQNMYKVLRERASMEWEWDALIPPSYINTFAIFSTFEEKTKIKTMSKPKTLHLTASPRPTKVSGWKFTHHGWRSNHWWKSNHWLVFHPAPSWNSDHLYHRCYLNLNLKI